jgi:hypothetical protein
MLGCVFLWQYAPGLANDVAYSVEVELKIFVSNEKVGGQFSTQIEKSGLLSHCDVVISEIL